MLKRMVLGLALVVTLVAVAHATARADGVKDDGDFVTGKYSEKQQVVVRHIVSGALRIPDWTPPKKTTNGNEGLTKKQLKAIMDKCWQEFGDSGCQIPNELKKVGDPADPAMAGPAFRVIAIQLVTRLQLPMPTPQIGPDPENNEWKMLAVGFPVWLWTSGPRTLSTSSSMSGVTFTLTARLRSTTFDTGDGHGPTCTAMTPYSGQVKPGSASPTCGHVYTTPSLPQGSYRVQAVAHWDVTWSVAGYGGVLPVTRTASAQLPIGELRALNR